MIYFLKEFTEKGVHSGSKARLDCEEIINKFSDVGIELNFFNKKDILTKFPIQVIKIFFELKRNDIVILQYPYYSNVSKFVYSIFNYLKKYKNIKIIILIHDIDSLRNNIDCEIQDEINNLNIADIVISHNKYMSKWLYEKGLSTKIVELGVFDYLCNTNIGKNIKFGKNIVIAGNLDERKSRFVYLLNKDSIQGEFLLYGPNYKESDIVFKVKYMGVEQPNILVEKLQEGFGLIWDGNSIQECSGNIGNYLKYNNPHKLSLYIAAGIPVIVWSKSAVAEFVNKNNIGITINNLNELSKKLDSIDENSYNVMVDNIRKIKINVINGKNLESVLKYSINSMEE